MAIEVTPTKRAIWLPLMTRLKTSWPRLSVPMRWTAPGGMYLSRTLISLGRYGAIQSAKIPQRTTSSTSASPSRPRGSLRRRRSSRAPDMAAADVAVVRRAISESCADTGIEPGHDEIGDERAEGEQGDRREHGTLHDRVVAIARCVDDQFPDARAGEDVLGKDGAREQAADGEREQGDGRQNRDAQGIAGDDPPFSQPEGARRADVVFAHDFEHGSADDAGEVADPSETHGKARHDQMQQLVFQIAPFAGADHRQPTQLNGEDQGAIDSDDEGLNRDCPHREHACELVDEAVAPDRGIAAERNGDQNGPSESGGD